MGALMRAHDWSRSVLGDPAGWPDVLKMAVATCLSSRFPMVVWWGKDLIMLYNDAWQPILGDTKHPQGMGRPGRDSWPETWPIVGKQFEDALNGTANWAEDLLLASDRHGYLEESYFTYSHSPLRDAAGEVVGVLSTVHETTSRVLSERRLRLLRELSNTTVQMAAERQSVDQACQHLVEKLCSNNPDISFALLYLRDKSGRAQLAGASGVDTALFSPAIDKDEDDIWRVGRVLRGSVSIVVTETAGQPLPGGVWPEPTQELAALALRRSDRPDEPFGALLVGVNSRRKITGDDADFLKLVAVQIAASLTAVQSLHDEKEAARVKELLIRELEHRTRNLLGVVQAISEGTRSGTSSLEDYAQEFNGRLGALGRVQKLLSSADDESITLSEVLRLELEALPPRAIDRISLDGPVAVLSRQSVQLLSLALHELITNSLKHGALNGSDGKISIRWKLHDVNASGSKNAIFEWTEKIQQPENTPASAPRGFGRVLLEEALAHQLNAKTHYQITGEGVYYTIDIPLANKVAPTLDA